MSGVSTETLLRFRAGEADVEGWQIRAGLTFGEASALLDWLEANRITQRELRLTPEGATVRWRTD